MGNVGQKQVKDHTEVRTIAISSWVIVERQNVRHRPDGYGAVLELHWALKSTGPGLLLRKER
jgi:hypothetical protein